MGYTTEFDGYFKLDQRLFDSQVLYLLEFSRTRRVKRDAAVLENAPDPSRIAVGLPLGEEGCYFVNQKWDKERGEISIVDYNRPPVGQPGLWCQWVPTADGGGIEWDGGEKFYRYIEWLQYLIDNFIGPWGYHLNGEVTWKGEDPKDTGRITVEANRIVSPAGSEQKLHEAVSPVLVPADVCLGLLAVQEAGIDLWNWHGVVEKAEELGYGATAAWVKDNLTTSYLAGVERGGFASDEKA